MNTKLDDLLENIGYPEHGNSAFNSDSVKDVSFDLAIEFLKYFLAHGYDINPHSDKYEFRKYIGFDSDLKPKYQTYSAHQLIEKFNSNL